MTLKIGVLMDAIEHIKPYKDTSFAMLLAAQARGHQLFYFEQQHVFMEDGEARVQATPISVTDQSQDYYQLQDADTLALESFDIILMRKDPPFDMEYIYTTYLLDMAASKGTLVVNPPAALRQVNEKFFISYFPKLTPKTLISKDLKQIRQFIACEKQTVVKPLDGMGGAGIFKADIDDANLNMILETVSHGQSQTIMVQSYIDAVTAGDKRIIVIDGEPLSHGLARIPQGSDFRANLAAGGRGEVQALTTQEYALCEQVKPRLKQLGLLFVGLDVIGGYLTEINVTSPTCLREIENHTDEKIAERFIALLESKVTR